MAKAKSQVPAVEAANWLREKTPAIMKMVPNSKVGERLLQIMLREVSSNPDLALCTRESLLDAAIQTATLGLEIGGTLAQSHLVPFNDRQNNRKMATLVVGYRGLITLMKRGNPEIRDVFPVLIREGDEYSLDPETSKLTHRFDPLELGREGKPLLGAYCRIRYKDGHTWDHVMTKADLDKRRKVSKTDKIWNQWTDEMYQKTVIRGAAKYVTLSAEVEAQFSEVDKREIDFSLNQPAPPVSGVEATKAALLEGSVVQSEATVEAPAQPEEPKPEVDPATGEELFS